MDHLHLVERMSTTFIMSIAGGYVALILRDAWRRFLRHRRMRREGLKPGTPVYLVVNPDEKSDGPSIKH